MEHLINMLIGIISGAFSSVIISVIFYIITREQSLMEEAKNMAYPLYIISLFSSKWAKECNSKIDTKSQLESSLKELDTNFSRYEPWRYYGELNKIMIEIDNFKSEGYAYQSIDDNTRKIIEEKTNVLIERLGNYEKTFGKHCFETITKNKVIRICALLLIALVVIMIVMFLGSLIIKC